MRIGDRSYESFELYGDVTRPADDASFVADLESAREPIAELGEAAVDAAVQAAGEIVASATLAVPVAPPAADLRDVRTPAPTPLELAVLALLDEQAAPARPAPAAVAGDAPAAAERDPGEPLGDACPTIAPAAEPARPPVDPAPVKPVAVVAVREPAPLPEAPNPSHVHLVLEDGAERVVVTVAVRGNEVNVGVRASDDQLAAALARNAATLDHAMRARGLDLASFSAERDTAHDEEKRQPPEPHERDTHAEPFLLEEIA